MVNAKTTMYAQVIRAFGTATEAFELTKIPLPVMAAQQMRIRVLASSVNPVDCKLRSGVYPAAVPEMPAILHSDVVGEVVEKGSMVTRFNIGDRVYGCAGGFKGSQGALAEFMVVDPDLMAITPKNLSVLECAALPLVSITAWLALFTRAKIHEGQNVLVHAAAGGVGSIALQLALWKKSNTFTTASSKEKGDFAQKCGATVINYKTMSVEDYVQKYTNGQGFDVVFDTIGGQNFAPSLAALKEAGTLCAISPCLQADLRPLHRKEGTLHYIFMPNTIMNIDAKTKRQQYGEILTEIASLAEQNRLKPLIGAVLPFTEIAKAHVLQEQQEVIGKIVLQQDLV